MAKSYKRLIWILMGGITYVEGTNGSSPAHSAQGDTERSSEVGRNEGKTIIKIIEEKGI